MDEISYRKRNEYVTVVVNHVRGKIVWASKGKNADTLKAFFAELGAARLAKLQAVTIDMSGAYLKAVTEAAPHAQIIFDRFHVQRLAHDAFDQVRRAEARAVATPEPGAQTRAVGVAQEHLAAACVDGLRRNPALERRLRPPGFDIPVPMPR